LSEKRYVFTDVRLTKRDVYTPGASLSNKTLSRAMLVLAELPAV